MILWNKKLLSVVFLLIYDTTKCVKRSGPMKGKQKPNTTPLPYNVIKKEMEPIQMYFFAKRTKKDIQSNNKKKRKTNNLPINDNITNWKIKKKRKNNKLKYEHENNDQKLDNVKINKRNHYIHFIRNIIHNETFKNYVEKKKRISYYDIPKNTKYKKYILSIYKKKQGKNTIYMIIAPKGSLHEKKTKEILGDPVKNYPWEISIPFHETITREQSPYYNFLKGEWAYLDYKRDSRRACGKIEGGLENYDGKGLKLEKGVDRPRYKEIPYYLDHGVEWRNFNHDELIQFDIDPDGNQDQTFLETEEDLEYRQWGNWNYSCAKETTQLNTAWRDPVLSKDLSNLIYPWNHKAHENHIIPYGYRGPSGFIPEPKLEWELAARGFFAGYFDDPNWNRIKYYRITKKLILEWHEADKNSTKIDKVKSELFGITSRKKYTSNQIKLINEHALLRAKEILLDHILDPNNDPDYITYYLDKHEPIDYIGGGNHKCSEEEIKDKTVVLNMCVYPVKQQHETYSSNMSIPEMAEMYHYYMTEIRGEGRINNLSEDPVEDKFQCYELQHDRKNFPALVSLYKPLWSNRKYGEEFGDALKKEEQINIKNFYHFKRKLKLRKKTRYDKRDMDMYNYLQDYENFDEEYDF
ncbi:conserved Plasmodium protein, unknown function [Plasmodium reichenowi]|uniref:UOS2 protein n=1 Tax=Plasmodium reichenowi TaxID=5854 RepID=A0A060RYB8_PLARE|nr:conserved Plasmodium protein, unknown function [Plasmodium reichenowi]